MTGGEFLAIGGAAASAAGKALGEDEGTKDQLRRLAESAPQMQLAANAFAARVAVKQQIILRLWQPLARLVGVRKEYFQDQFSQDLAGRTAGIADENIKAPPASIAVPAMEGLGLSLDEPDLKEMYLNLLASASDSSRDDAHPAFAEVIKQISAKEVKILHEVLSFTQLNLAKLKETVNPESRSYRHRSGNIMDLVDQSTRRAVVEPLSSMWIDNWVRLGLAEVTYSSWSSAEDAYSWVDTRPEYVQLLSEPGVGEISFDKGLLIRTSFGERFQSAVSPPADIVNGSNLATEG